MNCLIVGRTWEDEQECIAYGLNSHPPSPTTLEGFDYAQFNGDVISCHTIKPWSDYACSVECSQRVFDSAISNPMRVVIGMSDLHKIDDDSQLWDFAMIYDHSKGHRHHDKNTGVFALWWALNQGYDEVYTVGIDLVWDRELLSEVRTIIDNHPGQKVYKSSKDSWLPCEVKKPL